MAELLQQERLQPALLDRLTDDSPRIRKVTESTHPAGSSVGDEPDTDPGRRVHQSGSVVITGGKLRECVKRDLSWLFNTINLGSVEDLSDYPLVAKSVVNYGLPDLTGTSVNNINLYELERKLHEIILCFEPRILSKSLSIKIFKSDEMSHHAIRFEIECDIWAQPAPEHVQLNSDLDLGTGTFTFRDPSLG